MFDGIEFIEDASVPRQTGFRRVGPKTFAVHPELYAVIQKWAEFWPVLKQAFATLGKVFGQVARGLLALLCPGPDSAPQEDAPGAPAEEVSLEFLRQLLASAGGDGGQTASFDREGKYHLPPSAN